mmetsp:Transcript_38185/g.95618  ORF Transcript_38185/g.95618 Transcript_38185/m.95618 type:complete len:200 (-) Transcript_38185:314-913(-)
MGVLGGELPPVGLGAVQHAHTHLHDAQQKRTGAQLPSLDGQEPTREPRGGALGGDELISAPGSASPVRFSAVRVDTVLSARQDQVLSHTGGPHSPRGCAAGGFAGLRVAQPVRNRQHPISDSGVAADVGLSDPQAAAVPPPLRPALGPAIRRHEGRQQQQQHQHQAHHRHTHGDRAVHLTRTFIGGLRRHDTDHQRRRK